MRVIATAGLLLCLSCGALSADEEPDLTGAPPEALRESERSTLRWTDTRGTRRFQHGMGIEALAVAAGGTRIVSSAGIFDERLRIWDASSGEQVAAVPVESDALELGLASLARAGRERVVFTTPGGRVEVLDASTGKTVLRFTRACEGTSNIAVDREGRLMAAACGQDGKPIVMVHDLSTGEQVSVMRDVLRTQIQGVGMSPDGSRVYAWTGNDELWGWRARTGKRLGAVVTPGKMVFDAGVSPDGHWIVVRDEGLHLYDGGTGEQRFSVTAPKLNAPGHLLHGQPDDFLHVAFDPKGRWVASTHLFSTMLRIWDLEHARLLHTVDILGSAAILAVDETGTWIATGHGDGAIRRVDVLKGERLDRGAGGEGGFAVVAADREASRTATIHGDTVIVRDEASGATLHRLRHVDPVDDRGIEIVTMSPDGQRVVAAGAGISIWDATTGKRVAWIPGRKNEHPIAIGYFGEMDRVGSVAIDPNHEWIASVTHLGAIRVHDARTGKLLHAWPWGGGRTQLAAAPDGTSLLSLTEEDPRIRILDPKTGRVTRSIQRPEPPYVQPMLDVNPGGRWFVASGPEGLSIYTLAGRRVRTLEASEGTWTSVAAASYGPYVFAADDEEGVAVWHTKSGALLDRLRVDAPVLGLLARDGRVWIALGNGATQIYRHTPAD